MGNIVFSLRLPMVESFKWRKINSSNQSEHKTDLNISFANVSNLRACLLPLFFTSPFSSHSLPQFPVMFWRFSKFIFMYRRMGEGERKKIRFSFPSMCSPLVFLFSFFFGRNKNMKCVLKITKLNLTSYFFFINILPPTSLV